MNTMWDNLSSYSCINCGTRHNEAARARCGSKMKEQISIDLITEHDKNASLLL